MEKEIKITFNKERMAYQFYAEGFTHMEIIGIMEYYKNHYIDFNLKREKKYNKKNNP